jgi:hypothetical protein
MELEISGPLVIDDMALMLRVALDGLGLAFTFEEFGAEHVWSGKSRTSNWCWQNILLVMVAIYNRHFDKILKM